MQDLVLLMGVSSSSTGVLYDRSLSRRQKVFEGVYLGILRMVVYVHYWIAVGGSFRNTEQSTLLLLRL